MLINLSVVQPGLHSCSLIRYAQKITNINVWTWSRGVEICGGLVPHPSVDAETTVVYVWMQWPASASS